MNKGEIYKNVKTGKLVRIVGYSDLPIHRGREVCIENTNGKHIRSFSKDRFSVLYEKVD